MSSLDELSPSILLDQWLTAEGDSLKSLSDIIVEDVERKISTGKTRQAKLRDITRRRLTVENVTANIATLVISPHVEPGNLLSISTAKRKATRYGREDYPQRILAMILQTMEAAGFIHRYPFIFQQQNTTVEPTYEFLSLLQRHGVRMGDIGRQEGSESIWLNARRLDDDDEEGDFWEKQKKVLIDYTETTETLMLRDEMGRINSFIASADFRFDGETQAPSALRRMFILRSRKAPQAFNLSGRLFGGWWQDLKSDRRHLITIDGEPIADLDFSSCFANLAYIRNTGSLYRGDPYDIPGLEEHRDAAKLGMLSLLSRSHDMRRVSTELKEALPEGWTAKRLVESFARHHPDLAESFGRDIGVELMATESRIMVALLLKLETLGIPAMGLHDGIQVAVSNKSKAAEVMEEVSERLLGVALPVKEKAIRRPIESLMAAA